MGGGETGRVRGEERDEARGCLAGCFALPACVRKSALSCMPRRHDAQAYRGGDWQAARQALERCRTMRRNARGAPLVDGPCDVLLGVMGQHGYAAPAGWRGFRELTEK